MCAQLSSEILVVFADKIGPLKARLALVSSVSSTQFAVCKYLDTARLAIIQQFGNSRHSIFKYGRKSS